MTLKRIVSFIVMAAMIVSLSMLTYAGNGKNNSVVEHQTGDSAEKNYSAEANLEEEEQKTEYFETEVDGKDKYESLMKIKEHIDISNECFGGYDTSDDTEYAFEKILYDSIKREAVKGIENLIGSFRQE